MRRRLGWLSSASRLVLPENGPEIEALPSIPEMVHLEHAPALERLSDLRLVHLAPPSGHRAPLPGIPFMLPRKYLLYGLATPRFGAEVEPGRPD